ncbi:MAG: 6-carboxytetrahydropterin synthase QueD [Planctomycetota bacterium]
MYELSLETHFAAAHHLRDYAGECENLHGHNYNVEVIFAGEELNDLGMLLDFRDAKRLVGEAVDRLDHEYLNELEPFDRINPTTEQIARHLAEAVEQNLPPGVTIQKVRCWESEKCAASYRPEHE